ncbi:N-acetylmuramoyl-L-alanine amidase [Acetobacteraceae bacterium KSS8]|uniref:N-acetylmuramoyl-L-alanine amidase n=1 Tax=Endosaccharibacter trunci TaxID=2812733 RepID=A0ABT1W5K0_9PROT|nr:N-acetylmuramoyl-L-alanine amidase [Acetobacteraceae bacterium KSS8]
MSAIIDLPSPNCRARPDGAVIDTLVLHYTGMQSGQAAIDRLRDPAAEVSSHYVVEEDGRVFRLVAERLRAAHAGISNWRGRAMLNDSSIGIEIVNPGHEWGYRPFPPAQIDAVRALCLGILDRHPIEQRRIVGHSDIAPDRKQDPGELFPWATLAASGIGLFPHGVADAGTENPVSGATRLAPIRARLRSIGFGIDEEGEMDQALRIVLLAFQRRWRPETVNGLADAGTVARLDAVAALYA